jgi:hypothetical protein
MRHSQYRPKRGRQAISSVEVGLVPTNAAWGTRTFTDPAVSFGGGVRINVARHLEVRPDARAIVVLDGANSHTVGIFVVNIGYRF